MTKLFHFETEEDTFTCAGKDEAEARAELDFLHVQSGSITAGQAARAKVTSDGVDYGTWEEFVAKHKPVTTPITEDAPYDGCMYETFGEELEIVKKHANEQIFTLVEADGYTYACPGFHFVNRVGYLLVEQPWKPEEQDITYATN